MATRDSWVCLGFLDDGAWICHAVSLSCASTEGPEDPAEKPRRLWLRRRQFDRDRHPGVRRALVRPEGRRAGRWGCERLAGNGSEAVSGHTELEAREFARARNIAWAQAQLDGGGLMVVAAGRQVAAAAPGAAVPANGQISAPKWNQAVSDSRAAMVQGHPHGRMGRARAGPVAKVRTRDERRLFVGLFHEHRYYLTRAHRMNHRDSDRRAKCLL